jgi:hypothetical protein
MEGFTSSYLLLLLPSGPNNKFQGLYVRDPGKHEAVRRCSFYSAVAALSDLSLETWNEANLELY